MTAIPPALKLLTAFIRRAEELDKDQMDPDSRIVAYYCRTFAMERGIKMNLNTPDINGFLMSLMDSLELEKKSQTLDRPGAASCCENYAYSVFSKADNEDRLGEATKETAKTFYVASTYFDMLEQFGELDPEIQEKRKYSKWKATDIVNSIKAGRKPTPGAPGEESPVDSPPAEGSVGGLSINQTSPRPVLSPVSSPEYPATSTQFDLSGVIPAAPTAAPTAPLQIPEAPFVVHPPRSNNPPQGSPYGQMPPQMSQSPQQLPPQYQQQQQQIQPQSNPAPSYPSAPMAYAPPKGNSSKGTLDARAKDAIECASFAITALKHNNIALARERLKDALKQLE